ncbi:unnamed protein product [Blepharisma stoltei]|uniref:MIF4G domain-containing protein n=1 Tax=Blepharisma stoltei TaxID=1481888 RepID=A0AAU9I3E1_9CILI|nr:unnamed protein product [Blepharisma stoltei]
MESNSDPSQTLDQGLYTPKRLRGRTNSNYLSQSSQKNTYRKPSHRASTTKEKPKRVWKKVSKHTYSYDEILSVKSQESSQIKSDAILKILDRKLKTVGSAWRSTPQKLKSSNDELTKNFKSLLNKLAPTNAESIQNKLLALLSPESSESLSLLILEKASAEGKYAETYAKMCVEISRQISYFRNNLLTACQVMFENSHENGEFSDRKKVLGCVRFIGELFKAKLIPPKIICSCCSYMLELGSEDSIEALCYLLSVCNSLFASPRYKETFHLYVVKLQELAKNLSSRLRFQVLDLSENKEIKTLAIQKADAPAMLPK